MKSGSRSANRVAPHGVVAGPNPSRALLEIGAQSAEREVVHYAARPANQLPRERHHVVYGNVGESGECTLSVHRTSNFKNTRLP